LQPDDVTDVVECCNSCDDVTSRSILTDIPSESRGTQRDWCSARGAPLDLSMLPGTAIIQVQYMVGARPRE
jgi:hypothetical protein